LNISEFPYKYKIYSDDCVNYESVNSANRIKMDKVKAAFFRFFYCKSWNEIYMDIKYWSPLLEIWVLMV